MTTISALKGRDFIIIGADSQITSNNLKLPFDYQKIQRVGSNLVAGSGSVGYIQRLLAIALKNLRIEKILADNLDLSPTLEELAKELAELNFSLPLEHRHFNSFSFLLGGLDENETPALVSVGSEGSLIKIPTYFSDGSGSDFCISCLSQEYKPDLHMKEALKLIFKSLEVSTGLDCYTNKNPFVAILFLDGSGEKWEVKEFHNIQEVEDWTCTI